uniref:Uncharacterized protein n=1 Tax=Oryza glaberrima TaxID=4538 RepID=I1QAZ7_ORYGL
MELYAVVMTTTTEPSCIFLGGPCSSRRANGDTVMLKNDGNKRMGTNRSNASSTGSGVLPARYDTLQSDMCIVTRDARKARRGSGRERRPLRSGSLDGGTLIWRRHRAVLMEAEAYFFGCTERHQGGGIGFHGREMLGIGVMDYCV